MPVFVSYDPRLVALSVLIASFASYIALDLAGRTTAAHGRARAAWLACGSLVMGVGIWSMHFIGMLAFSLRTAIESIPIAYHPGQLLGSVVVAVAASALALGVASRRKLDTRALLAAAVSMGTAIAGMHYLGIAAMRMNADVLWSAQLVGLSLAIAIVASLVALLLARRLGETKSVSEHWAKRAAAGVMGVAIAGMHYTGMAAASFTMPEHAGHVLSGNLVPISGLAVSISVGAIIVMMMALLGITLDRQHTRRLEERMRVGEARYHSLTQSVTDGIVSANTAGQIVFCNAAAERIFGRDASEIVGLPFTLLLSPNQRARYRTAIYRLAEGAPCDLIGKTIEVEGQAQDGVFPMELAISQWADGAETFFTAVVRDITERKRTESVLRESERRFRNLVEQSPEAIVLHARGVLLYANPTAAALIGAASPEEFKGRSMLDLVHPDSRAFLASTQDANGPEWRHVTHEYRILHRDGRVLDVEATSVPATFDGRSAVQTHIRNVTAQKQLEAQLAHQAFHDAVTGLANRALFRDRVGHAITRGIRQSTGPAVLFLDLDNFKSINDGLGHAAGDELLRAIAARLTSVIRGSDTCARLGGDEFGVLVEDPAEAMDAASNAAHVAERMHAALRTPFHVGGAEIVITVSIGIAVAREGDSSDDLLRNADLAMYRAKGGGKGRYEVFEQPMHEVVRKRLQLETELRHAIEGGLDGPPSQAPFVVHYQPIAALGNGQVKSYEALVRWHHPERGLVPPMEFIPVAEETGMIVPLGRWILREACRQTMEWQRLAAIEGDQPVGVSVNISARQLMQPELPHDVAAALHATGLAPESLTLEVTESMLVDDSNATLERLRALKALGVRIAIDDFGTGYSSLGYLERFAVDLLKIDKSFIDQVGTLHTESPLARAIVGLGRELGMDVVAEGIENEAQWTRLRDLGCDLGQGYFLAKPRPASELTAAVRRSHAA